MTHELHRYQERAPDVECIQRKRVPTRWTVAYCVATLRWLRASHHQLSTSLGEWCVVLLRLYSARRCNSMMLTGFIEVVPVMRATVTTSSSMCSLGPAACAAGPLYFAGCLGARRRSLMPLRRSVDRG